MPSVDTSNLYSLFTPPIVSAVIIMSVSITCPEGLSKDIEISETDGATVTDNVLLKDVCHWGTKNPLSTVMLYCPGAGGTQVDWASNACPTGADVHWYELPGALDSALNIFHCLLVWGYVEAAGHHIAYFEVCN